MKRLENIEGKNKDQLDAIKNQGEKQLDGIEIQKEKRKITEKDKIVYLEDKIDKLFEMHPKYFSQGKKLLEILVKTENKINYKNLFYKILLSDGRLHEFIFFKKYDTLYSLLEDLVTKKMTVNSANAAQISFIIDLMHGYDESKLVDIKAVKNEFFYNTVLTKAKKVFLDAKENPKKRIKSFFPPKFKESLSKEQ